MIGRGLVDDGPEGQYLVLRNESGRIVYAEFSMTAGQTLLDRGAKISLIAGLSPEIAIVRQMTPFPGRERAR